MLGLFMQKNIRLQILFGIKLFYFEYSVDIGEGLAKIMHRTSIYLPYKTPEQKLLDFWNGGANVKQFSQTPK